MSDQRDEFPRHVVNILGIIIPCHTRRQYEHARRAVLLEAALLLIVLAGTGLAVLIGAARLLCREFV
jgi:hypothetical protein